MIMSQKKLAVDRIRTERDDKVSSLYQLDPAFYRKILSRNSSSGGCSGRFSLHHRPGKVPFNWEMQPGEPRDVPEEDMVPPIELPPAARGPNVARPSVPPSGPRAFLLKKLKKMNRGKGIRLKQPSPAVQGLTPPSSNVAPGGAKKYFMKNINKLKLMNGIHTGKKLGHKSQKKRGAAVGRGDSESDGFEFSNSDAGDFASSSTNSSTDSSSSSSFSFSRAMKSPKVSHLFNVSKGVMKWKKQIKQGKQID